MNIERTLILFKPDALQRMIIGKIINRFEEKGLKIVGLKMMEMTDEIAAKHYHAHINKSFFPMLVKFMKSAPIIAMVIEGESAINVCRKITGATFGIEAEPGTIRGDYSNSSTCLNLIHSSENKEAVEIELPIFFKEEEIFNYTQTQGTWIHE